MIERLDDLERQVAALPRVVPQPQPGMVALIAGGQVEPPGIHVVTYSASVSAGAYDPDDVGTDLPDGLGRAWLYVDGRRAGGYGGTGRVLIRHDIPSPAASPWIIAGTSWVVREIGSLGSGATLRTVYFLGFPIA